MSYYGDSRRRRGMSTTKIVILCVVVLCIAVGACIGGCSIAPAYKEKYETIAPDETCFVIPLEEGTKAAQQQFESVDYLNGKKVAAKRILIPQRLSKQGRFRKDYKYIEGVLCVKVSRAWVSREWTEERETGTTEKQQALRMESKDSIGFRVPCNLNANITEADTALFLYEFGGEPLEEIIDGPIRNDAQSELAIRFGDVNLRDVIAAAKGELSEEAALAAVDVSKKEIFSESLKRLAEKYKKVGITITTFGPAGQLQYEDKEIQDAINTAFAAEIDVKAAESEKKAEDTRIEMRAAMAKSYEENKEAQEALKRLEIDMVLAEAVKAAAAKGTPIVPQYMSGSGGGGMIMQMMQRQSTTSK